MAEKTPERLALEAKAKALDISFAWNTGDDTLAARVAEAEATKNKTSEAGLVKQPDTPVVPTSAGAKDGAPATQPTVPAAIVVIGPKSGRRRAGRRFGPEPVTISSSELSPAEIAALEADPKLHVSVVAPETD